MIEKLNIINFGGLDNVKISLNSINILIGKQASGKSVSAKLIYYFKGVFMEIYNGIKDEKSKVEIDKGLIKKFEEYFPLQSWPDKPFEITYFYGDESLKVSNKKRNKIKIEYSEGIKKQFSTCRRLINKDKANYKPEDDFDLYRPSFSTQEAFLRNLNSSLEIKASSVNIFVPAGRSFFANLQSNIFSFLSNNKNVDPFLIEFGSFYESMKSFPTFARRKESAAQKHISELIYDILGSKHVRDKNKDYLIHSDNRKINVSFSSSGQQEILPLAVILSKLVEINFTGDRITVFIEEPEAHLFPTAQKRIVELIATVFNDVRNDIQFIITTHSPYILTSFNNLIQAGKLVNEYKNKPEVIEKIHQSVSNLEIISPDLLSAFAMENKTCIDMRDKETDLINSDLLDDVSDEIAIQFDALIDVE